MVERPVSDDGFVASRRAVYADRFGEKSQRASQRRGRVACPGHPRAPPGRLPPSSKKKNDGPGGWQGHGPRPNPRQARGLWRASNSFRVGVNHTLSSPLSQFSVTSQRQTIAEPVRRDFPDRPRHRLLGFVILGLGCRLRSCRVAGVLLAAVCSCWRCGRWSEVSRAFVWRMAGRPFGAIAGRCLTCLVPAPRQRTVAYLQNLIDVSSGGTEICMLKSSDHSYKVGSVSSTKRNREIKTLENLAQRIAGLYAI
jgi:hypothetical protein